MKKVYYWVFAAILICGTTAVSLSLTSCNEAQAEDNPIPEVKSKELIRTSQSWDGVELPDYLVGAFVGDECRGTTTLTASGSTQLVIYGRSAGESVTVKYFDAAAGKLYTIPNAVKM